MANENKGESPKYKLLERAYIDDVLYEEGATITYEGIPGYHMEAANAAATAMKVGIQPVEEAVISNADPLGGRPGVST